jgi:ParB-like chromosome segregation protein Spo0J
MMVTQNFPVKQLSLLENNPRKITKEQFNKLIKSMQDDPDFLWKRPLLVNKVEGKHTVYAGNQRLRAAKKLKWTEIPCIVEQNLTDEIMKSRIVKDNKAFGNWDWDELANSFEVEDLLECGFSLEELGDFSEKELLDKDGELDSEKEEKVKCELCGK